LEQEIYFDAARLRCVKPDCSILNCKRSSIVAVRSLTLQASMRGVLGKVAVSSLHEIGSNGDGDVALYFAARCYVAWRILLPFPAWPNEIIRSLQTCCMASRAGLR